MGQGEENHASAPPSKMGIKPNYGIAFTLNQIYLQDHSTPKSYETIEEEMAMPMAAAKSYGGLTVSSHLQTAETGTCLDETTDVGLLI